MVSRHHSITFGKPQIDLDKLRDFKSGVVKKQTGGLTGMAKMRKVDVVTAARVKVLVASVMQPKAV